MGRSEVNELADWRRTALQLADPLIFSTRPVSRDSRGRKPDDLKAFITPPSSGVSSHWKRRNPRIVAGEAGCRLAASSFCPLQRGKLASVRTTRISHLGGALACPLWSSRSNHCSRRPRRPRTPAALLWHRPQRTVRTRS